MQQTSPVRQRFQPLLLLHYAVLIALESTLLHLCGTLLAAAGLEPILQWPVLFGVVTISALANTWLEPIDGARARIGGRTASVAIATILAATWLQGRGQLGANPFGALTNIDDEAFLPVYLLLAFSGVAWWRGARVVDADHVEVVRILRWGIILLTAALLVLALAGVEHLLAQTAAGASISPAAELVIFLGLGLAALSMTRIAASASDGASDAPWRWLRSSLFSTAVLLLIGIMLLGIVAEPARWVLANSLFWIVYVIMLLLSPLLWVLFKLVEILQGLLMSRGWRVVLPPPAPEQPRQQPESISIDSLAAILNASTTIAVLLPLLVLALLIFLSIRRRGRGTDPDEEQRESIFSWRSLGRDMLDLLRSVRPHRASGGLQAALGRLAGHDPRTRIRRRYIQLLLLGEQRGTQRPPPATPHEFEPALPVAPAAQGPLHTLTRLYERARYGDGLDDAAAAHADASWGEIEQRDRPAS